MKLKENILLFLKGIQNSYGQVFFSDNLVFSIIIFLVTFIDLYAGLLGFLSVVATNTAGFLIGFDRRLISKGYYGFNSLLVGLGLGVYFQPDLLLILIVCLAAVMTLLISVSLQGVIGKYALPYLSVPFLLAIWTMSIATKEFSVLGISERGIYTFNDLYILGGPLLVKIYEWWNNLGMATSLRTYFISLGAILFQYNLLSGVLIAIGLFLYSRISFTLSLLGFYTAYVFYNLIGADISELGYSYIGFNYILTAIAVGGFFIIPSRFSYAWILLLIPIVAMITISLAGVFAVFRLPIYSLPFNLIVLLFLYALKFRISASPKLAEVLIQQNSPEKNLYSYHNDMVRFRHHEQVPVKLPFYGIWSVSQAHNGEHTHKGDWRFAWDFVITDQNNRQFKGSGDQLEDYYCYEKAVLAPADGTIEFTLDDIEDNSVGDVNTKDNWGNTVIIKHSDHLYSSLSHLKPGSVSVKEGDKVRQGDVIGRCGNSGRSPYPHLHIQFQETPYIGSRTLYYPFSYYISQRNGSFSLYSFDYPSLGQQISNTETNDLLQQAFSLIPGRKLCFNFLKNGLEHSVTWEVYTDAFNNTILRCLDTGSKAYFTTDKNLLYFKHFEGDKTSLLYFFFLAVFKLQLGYYQDMVLKDRYPLNLIFRQPLLSLQDILAPFWKFQVSAYELRYDWIDNEMSPRQIRLTSAARNFSFGRLLRTIEFTLQIGEPGITEFEVKSKKLNIKAVCCELDS